jgi:hypothetical protein
MLENLWEMDQTIYNWIDKLKIYMHSIPPQILKLSQQSKNCPNKKLCMTEANEVIRNATGIVINIEPKLTECLKNYNLISELQTHEVILKELQNEVIINSKFNFLIYR